MHLRAAAPAGIADDPQGLGGYPVLEPREMLLAVPPDPEFQPGRQRIHDRDPDAVQPAGNLVAVRVEFPARMQVRHDHLRGGDALLVDVDRNPPAVVAHRDALVGMDAHRDGVGVTGEGLVDPVVHDLIHHVMQAGSVIGVADVHPRAFSHGFQALEDLYGIGLIEFLRLLIPVHVSCLELRVRNTTSRWKFQVGNQ